MRRRDEDGSRPRRPAPAGIDDQTLLVDRDRMRAHLGEQKLCVGQRIAGILDPHLLAWRKQHADRDVDRLLGARGNDDLIRFALNRARRPQVVA